MVARKGSGFPFPAQLDPPPSPPRNSAKSISSRLTCPNAKSKHGKLKSAFRVRQDLRTELEQFAVREKRKLGNVGEALLEWGKLPPH